LGEVLIAEPFTCVTQKKNLSPADLSAEFLKQKLALIIVKFGIDIQ
jgi:hypothetical protein